MKTTWRDDSDSSSSGKEEHVANMCFMAIEIDNDVLFSDDKSDLSYNELHDVFETLYNEYKKLGSKYSLLKKKTYMFTY
jgi:hypothetical protein